MKPSKKEILKHIGAYKGIVGEWRLPKAYSSAELRSELFDEKVKISEAKLRIKNLEENSKFSADVEDVLSDRIDGLLARVGVLEHRMNKASLFFKEIMELLGIEWEIIKSRPLEVKLRKKRSNRSVKKKKTS